MLTVVNKRTHIPTENDIYIGRPEILGNPFPVSMGRDECIEAYREYFDEQVQNNTEFKGAVMEIVEREMKGLDTNLVCWCAPLSCHGDVIKEYVENYI